MPWCIGTDLVSYYKTAAEELDLLKHMSTGIRITNIQPSGNKATGRFIVDAVKGSDGKKSSYSCDYLVFSIGPRSKIRSLEAHGLGEGYISFFYTSPDDYPGERLLVVGGGRSADWAAQELHDAGRTVVYVMRQKPEAHLKLIHASQHLPYYLRWTEILQGDQRRMGLLYESEITEFKPNGLVMIRTPEGVVKIEVDHSVVEIGGDPDYGLLESFGELTLHAKRDNFRFQLMQMVVDQATFESVNIPGLYPSGYLAQGTGLSVIGFHAGCFLIAGDILRKLDAV